MLFKQFGIELIKSDGLFDRLLVRTIHEFHAISDHITITKSLLYTSRYEYYVVDTYMPVEIF